MFFFSDVFRSYNGQNIHRQLGCWSCVSNRIFDTRISTKPNRSQECSSSCSHIFDYKRSITSFCDELYRIADSILPLHPTARSINIHNAGRNCRSDAHTLKVKMSFKLYK